MSQSSLPLSPKTAVPQRLCPDLEPAGVLTSCQYLHVCGAYKHQHLQQLLPGCHPSSLTLHIINLHQPALYSQVNDLKTKDDEDASLSRVLY